MGGRCHGWPWFTHLHVRRRVEGPVWAASGLTPGSWALTTVLGGPFLLRLSLQGLDPPAARPPPPGPAARSLGTGLCPLKHGRDAPAPPHSPSPSVVPPPRPRTAVGAYSTPNTHTHTLDLTLTQSCRRQGRGCCNRAGWGDQGLQARGPPGCVLVTPEGPGSEVWSKSVQGHTQTRCFCGPQNSSGTACRTHKPRGLLPPRGQKENCP